MSHVYCNALETLFKLMTLCATAGLTPPPDLDPDTNPWPHAQISKQVSNDDNDINANETPLPLLDAYPPSTESSGSSSSDKEYIAIHEQMVSACGDPGRCLNHRSVVVYRCPEQPEAYNHPSVVVHRCPEQPEAYNFAKLLPCAARKTCVRPIKDSKIAR